MAVVLAFLLGMSNFACHAAVLGSGHTILSQISADRLRLARWASLALDFGLLCGALYAANNGHSHWVWFYAGYTLLNIGASWSILTGRLG